VTRQTPGDTPRDASANGPNIHCLRLSQNTPESAGSETGARWCRHEPDPNPSRGRAAIAMGEGGAGSAARRWSAADPPGPTAAAARRIASVRTGASAAEPKHAGGPVPDPNLGTCSRTRRAAAGSPQLHAGAYARHLRLPCAAGANMTLLCSLCTLCRLCT
jgi:hypothetical protein